MDRWMDGMEWWSSSKAPALAGQISGVAPTGFNRLAVFGEVGLSQFLAIARKQQSILFKINALLVNMFL
jgi:hypothetical protein